MNKPDHPSMLHPSFNYGDAEHAHYVERGYFVFDRFLSDEGLERCRTGMDAMIEQLHPDCTPEDMICPHQLGDRWIWDLATEPRLLDMIERHIGPNLVFWSSHALAKPPRTGIEVPWHQDAPYWNVGGPLPGAVWVPLDDCSDENGTMSILPDRHRDGELPRLIDRPDTDPDTVPKLFQQQIDPEVLPENADDLKVTYRLGAGQMATHHTMLPHCSTPNRSMKWRRVIVLRYMTADGEQGGKTYTSCRTREPFERAFYLVRGEDVLGRGLPRSPSDDESG